MSDKKTEESTKKKGVGKFYTFFTSPEEKKKEDLRSPSGSGGTPIFKREEVYEPMDTLAQLLRYIFVEHNITWENFNYHITLHGNRMRLPDQKITTDKGNYKKEVVREKITFDKFDFFLRSILGFSIEDFGVILVDERTGNRYEHRISDVVKEIEELNAKMVKEKEQEKE